jgi:hypothetical protein
MYCCKAIHTTDIAHAAESQVISATFATSEEKEKSFK